MSRLATTYDHTVYCVLIRSEDGLGWCSWCPEVDVMSCGDTPNHAIAMLEDAIKAVCEHDLSRWNWSHEVMTEKKVEHPLRRGVDAPNTEFWLEYKKFSDYVRGVSREHKFTEVDIDHLDQFPNEQFAFLFGRLEIRSRAGIVSVSIRFDDYRGEIYVPAKVVPFKAIITKRIERAITMPMVMEDEVATSELEAELRRQVHVDSDEIVEVARK